MKPRDDNSMRNEADCRGQALRSGAAGRPRKGEAALRRSHLIDVARALFLDKGYYDVSLALIAQEARVAVRTIYLGFGSKAGLFSAVLQQGRQRFMADEPVLDPAGSIREVLGNFGLRYLHYITDPAMARLRRMVLSEAGTSPDLKQSWWEAGPAPAHALLTRYFLDVRIQAQLSPDVPFDLLPAHFMACIAGEHAWPYPMDANAAIGRPLQQLLDARMALFLRSVLLKPSP
jgi:TetR/AcrR family transcriptional repressor of mexJK operon